MHKYAASDHIPTRRQVIAAWVAWVGLTAIVATGPVLWHPAHSAVAPTDRTVTQDVIRDTGPDPVGVGYLLPVAGHGGQFGGFSGSHGGGSHGGGFGRHGGFRGDHHEVRHGFHDRFDRHDFLACPGWDYYRHPPYTLNDPCW